MDNSDPLASASMSLKAKTGKDLPEWVTIARKSGIGKHKPLVDHLKSEHGLTHGYANTIALKCFESDAGSIGDDALMASMFDGPKGHLRPIYDLIIEKIGMFGDDVSLVPKKGYVSIRRAKQFAIAQPSTKDRFDLGLTAKTLEPGGRLEPAGSWNAMVTHRVRLARVEDVDAEVVAWLRLAYDGAGGKAI
jgi:Domain of unknown function (DUF5655)/Domain of unknown function (DUF4287)